MCVVGMCGWVVDGTLRRQLESVYRQASEEPGGLEAGPQPGSASLTVQSQADRHLTETTLHRPPRHHSTLRMEQPLHASHTAAGYWSNQTHGPWQTLKMSSQTCNRQQNASVIRGSPTAPTTPATTTSTHYTWPGCYDRPHMETTHPLHMETGHRTDSHTVL